jgi:hypothetical protein
MLKCHRSPIEVGSLKRFNCVIRYPLPCATARASQQYDMDSGGSKRENNPDGTRTRRAAFVGVGPLISQVVNSGVAVRADPALNVVDYVLSME